MGFCQKVEELSMILSTLTFERRGKIIRLRCDLVPFECRLDRQIGAFSSYLADVESDIFA